MGSSFLEVRHEPEGLCSALCVLWMGVSTAIKQGFLWAWVEAQALELEMAGVGTWGPYFLLQLSLHILTAPGPQGP